MPRTQQASAQTQVHQAVSQPALPRAHRHDPLLPIFISGTRVSIQTPDTFSRGRCNLSLPKWGVLPHQDEQRLQRAGNISAYTSLQEVKMSSTSSTSLSIRARRRASG